jgi:hypothetical protein
MLEALTPKKRGRKIRGMNPLAQRVAQLERDNARLSQQLKQAETIIEVQKKVSELLGMSREGRPPGGSLSWATEISADGAPGGLFCAGVPRPSLWYQSRLSDIVKASGRHRRSP